MAEQANEHDQAFFLDLATKGKEEWKEWQRLNRDVRVTFADVDFSTPRWACINFSGFDFGDNADLSATFGSEAPFSQASFGDDANFRGATFHGKANHD